MSDDNLITYCKEFGITLTGITAFSRVLRKIHSPHLTSYEAYKYRRIEHWLDKNYGDIISSFESKRNRRTISKNTPIYIYFGIKVKMLCRQL